MTPERWKRVEELYHTARARPAGERAAFLAGACPDDEALRHEVQSLLNERVSADGSLAELALPMAAHRVSDVAPPPMTGRRLGGYHLQTLIGAGGMGEVYRARDATLGRDVAIKILPLAFTKDPDRLARFEREARMLASLNHPNICAIYGLEEADGIRFLILELVDGETLDERLHGSRHKAYGSGDSKPSAISQQPSRGLDLTEALAIARQIADALDAAHERGIVHRDLKPANIKITPNGAVKVLDLGIAKAVSADASSPDLTQTPTVTIGATREGVILGTAAYMSPEQARGKVVDKRADIWAFGCVLYEMLTGRLTFAGDTVSDTIAKILEREPDWSALPAATPARIRRLLLRCLAKDPKQRLRDIGEVRIEIDAIDEVLPGASDVTVAAPRRWRTALGVAVVVLSLLTAVATWLTRGAAQAPVDNPLVNATSTQVTNWEGSELDAAISPDGKFVAFLADQNGPFHAFLGQVGAEGVRNLTPGKEDHRNSAGARNVGFSADGSDIWLSGNPRDGRRLRLMPFMGGEPRAFLSEHAQSLAWSPDGTRVAYFTSEDGDPISIADRTGGNVRQILVDRKGVHNHFPTWSPDGQWIYYVHMVESADVWRIPASGGARERLTHHNDRAMGYPTPIDARTLLYVAHAEDRSGPWLWALDVDRKSTRRVSFGLEKYLSVAASADGRRLVASVANPSATLWSVPILDRLAEELDVTPYPLQGVIRALAPRFGGTSLFYLSSRSTGDGLWRFQDGQAFEIWKGSDGVLLAPPAVSRDGSRTAVALRKQTKVHLRVVSADGTEQKALSEAVDVQGTAAWSPDGKWIVAGGTDAQSTGLFKIPIDGGTPIRIVDGEAIDPVWSPDGRVIVYAGQVVASTRALLAVDPDGRPVSLPAIQVMSGGARFRFLPNGKGLVYMQGTAVTSKDFWLLDVTTNTTRQLTRLSNPATMFAFDVTPDSSHIVFDRLKDNSNIVLIDLPK